MTSEIFTGWMQRLCAVLIFDLPEKTMKEYYRHLSRISDDHFAAICDQLSADFQSSKHKQFPSVADFKILSAQLARQSNENVSCHVTDTPATPDETRAFFRVLEEIKNWHAQKLVQYNKNGCEAMSAEDWDFGGRPATWSPVLDRLLSLICDDRAGTKYAEICDQYRIRLIDERIKRTTKNF